MWGLQLGARILRNDGRGEGRRHASLLRRKPGSVELFVSRDVYWAQERVKRLLSLPALAAEEFAEGVRSFARGRRGSFRAPR